KKHSMATKSAKTQ
ncbi:beta-hexosaminidase, partial [Vibrio parahaemolyticus V-223/04]